MAWGQYKIGLNLQRSQLPRDHAWEDNDEVERMVDCPEPCTEGFHGVYGIPCHHMIARVVNSNRMVGPEMFAKQWWLVRKADLGKRPNMDDSVEQPEIDENAPAPPTTYNFHQIHNPPIVNVRRKTIGTDQYHVIEISDSEDEVNGPQSQLPRFTGDAGTLRRLPSGFEHAEAEVRASGSTQRAPKRRKTTKKCSICRQAGHTKNNCADRLARTEVVVIDDDDAEVEIIDATVDMEG